MKKKFNVITILALLGLIVASSITLGKVFAYFGAKSSASGAIEMGTLSIGGVTKGDGASIDWDIPNLQPNQSFGGSYKVEVNSNINYYIRILFKASVTPQSGSTHINGTACEDYVEDDTDILSISIDGATTNTYQKSSVKTADGYTPYYRLSPTKVTSNTTTETFNIDLKINDWVGCNYCHYYMKADVVVNMRVQIMQADYLESNATGGTVSTVDEMHDLWVAGGLETKIDDISDYPDLTFTVLSADDKTMSVKAANTSITTANIPAMVKKDGKVYTVTGIAYNGFYNCSNLTSVTIPDTVTSIGSSAFSYCKSLTSIDIPSGVTSIGYNAFLVCTNLTSISIPDSVTSIDVEAFSACSNLQYNTYDNAKYLGNDTNPYVVLVKHTSTSITSCTINSNCKMIYYQAFYGCKSLTSITIPDSVTDIGESAFSNCTGLTSISIPNSVTSIEDGAFYNCSALTSISLPSTLTSIGSSTFYNCASLTSIDIPSGVTSIGRSSFYGCSNLQYNTYDNGKYLGNDTNPYVVLVDIASTSMTFCDINSNCKIIYHQAFSLCKSLTSITIPKGVTSIGSYAFYNCTGLTSISLPSTLTSIGSSTFYNCTSLTSIDIPSSVTSIGESTFSNCTSLTTINVANSNSAYKSIDGVLFNKDLSSLIKYPACKIGTSYIIPNCVTSIEDAAFEYCSNLTSIYIPSSVANIGAFAFEYCSNLTFVAVPISVTSIGSHAFATNGCCNSSSISITYAGTVSQMSEIHSTNYAATNTTCYTIVCSDGSWVMVCYEEGAAT